MMGILVSLLLAVPCVAQDKPLPAPTLADVTGDYYYGDGLGVNRSLTIDKAGTFTYRWDGCLGEYDRAAGTASIQDGHLILKPDQPGDRKRLRAIDTDFAPVRWGERTYLIPYSNGKAFCSAINGGVSEPRDGAHGSFYLRKGDWEKKVDGLPTVPKTWQPWLLAKPVRGAVTAVLPGGKAIVNMGSRDGVCVGLEMWNTNDFSAVEVIAVAEGSCTVRAPDHQGAEGGFKVGHNIQSRCELPPEG